MRYIRNAVLLLAVISVSFVLWFLHGMTQVPDNPVLTKVLVDWRPRMERRDLSWVTCAFNESGGLRAVLYGLKGKDSPGAVLVDKTYDGIESWALGFDARNEAGFVAWTNKVPTSFTVESMVKKGAECAKVLEASLPVKR